MSDNLSRTAWTLDHDAAVDLLDGGDIRAAKDSCQGGPSPPTTQIADSVSDPLPIEVHLPTILSTVREHRVVCLQGETGCGKSSMVPLALLREMPSTARILVTQPRRIAAISLAARVASLLGEAVGQRVGYRIANERVDDGLNTRILFVTTGYLLQALVHGATAASAVGWDDVTHVVLDEVHERSLEADMLSLILKLRLSCEKSKKLLIMSATMQSALFSSYFAPVGTEGPYLKVGARRCPVLEYFLEGVGQFLGRSAGASKSLESALERYAEKVDRPGRVIILTTQDCAMVAEVALGASAPSTCVLVFLPGLTDIEVVYEELRKRQSIKNFTLRILVLHSVVSSQDQALALRPARVSECKIILATNIAETSVTIPDVKVVIDLGMVRRLEFDKERGIRSLVTGWCSQSAAKQRAGRAGRVSPGTVLRLYPHKIYETRMPNFDPSELLPLDHSVLMIRSLLSSYGTPEELMVQMVEPPSPQLVQAALMKLVEWGCLGAAPEYRVLSLGYIAAALPLDVRLSRGIVLASKLGCAGEMLVVACGLTLQRSPMQRPLRVYYANETEYVRALHSNVEAQLYFDRHRYNDMLFYCALHEEALPISTNAKAYRDMCSRKSLIQRHVSTFLSTVVNVARRFLPYVGSVPNRDVLESLAAGRSIKFHVYKDVTMEMCFNIVLAVISDRALLAKGLRSPYIDKICGLKYLHNTAVFQGVDSKFIKLGNRTIGSMFSILGPVDFLDVKPKENTIVLSFGSSLSIPGPVLCVEPVASLQTLSRLVRHHPHKKLTLPVHGGDEGVSLPSAGFPRTVLWSSFERQYVVHMDRWSILSTLSDMALDAPKFEVSFAFSIVGGATERSTSLMAMSSFMPRRLRHFPFVCLLSSVQIENEVSFRVDRCATVVSCLFHGGMYEEVYLPLTSLIIVNALRLAPACKEPLALLQNVLSDDIFYMNTAFPQCDLSDTIWLSQVPTVKVSTDTELPSVTLFDFFAIISDFQRQYRTLQPSLVEKDIQRLQEMHGMIVGENGKRSCGPWK